MIYQLQYNSPLGLLTLRSDSGALLSIEFPDTELAVGDDVILLSGDDDSDMMPSAMQATVSWLDSYFAGAEPEAYPPMKPQGSPFRQRVWELLCTIPSGEVTTYGELARTLAEERGIQRMAAQAVGGAVGANPIPIIIPCHRVIGTNGSLTGYGGGVQFKVHLLEHEQFETAHLSWPTLKTQETMDADQAI